MIAMLTILPPVALLLAIWISRAPETFERMPVDPYYRNRCNPTKDV